LLGREPQAASERFREAYRAGEGEHGPGNGAAFTLRRGLAGSERVCRCCCRRCGCASLVAHHGLEQDV
jgi:hypothetical protein